MVLKRYLIHFSYTGTYFKGAQRQCARNMQHNEDPSTVQGLIEYALTRSRPINPVVLSLSSRTDRGVHAIRTAGCVDLEYEIEMTSDTIHYFLNRFFSDTELDIRILSVTRVAKDFRVRSSPIAREYLYKLAILKPGSLPESYCHKYMLPVPGPEFRRCYYVPNSKFNVELMRDASKLFIGSHDYLSFVANAKFQPAHLVTIRTINGIDIEPGHPSIPSFTDEYYQYWNVTIRGISFVYRQIRRMIAAMLAVAQERVPISEVQRMLDEPSPSMWPAEIDSAPSHGLYLLDVKYDPKDMLVGEDELEAERKEMLG